MMAGIGLGWNERGDELLRSRREMAQAFNEFQRMNPEASPAEFQSFIDQYSGGSNYIRGGAPSREVINQISERGRAQAAQRRMMENLQMMSQRAQIAGQMQAAAQEFVMGAEVSELPQRYNQFANMMFGGEVPEEYSFVQQYFDPEYVMNQRNAEIATQMPRVLQLMEQFPEASDQQLLQMAGVQGGPASFGTELISQARSRFDEQRQTREAEEARRRSVELETVRNEMGRALANANIPQLLATGNEDQARAQARAIFDRYSPMMEGYENAPDFDTVWSDFTATATLPAQAVQESAYPMARQQQRDLRNQAELEMRTQYEDSVSALISDGQGNPGDMVFGEELLHNVVLDFSNRYEIGRDEIALLYDHLAENFYQNENRPPAVADVVAEAETFLMGLAEQRGLRTRQELGAEWNRMARIRVPELPDIQNMEQFEDSARAELDRGFSEFERRFEEIAVMPSSEGEAALDALERDIEFFIAEQFQYILQAQSTARDANGGGWLLAGSRFDQEAFNRLGQALENHKRRMQDLIGRYSAVPQQRPENRTSAAEPDLPPPDMTYGTPYTGPRNRNDPSLTPPQMPSWFWNPDPGTTIRRPTGR